MSQILIFQNSIPKFTLTNVHTCSPYGKPAVAAGSLHAYIMNIYMTAEANRRLQRSRQISCKSVKSLPRYLDFSIFFNMAAVTILDF